VSAQIDGLTAKLVTEPRTKRVRAIVGHAARPDDEALLRAFERRELRLAYQPIYRLSTGRMTKVEALLRWSHRSVLIPPTDFVPWMEEIGVMWHVGRWVIETVCEQAVIWNRTHGPARVSLNVSPRQLEAGDLVPFIAECLARTSCKAKWLEVEITEECFIQDLPSVRQALFALSKMGITIAMDDFGTGYSSLACLTELPIKSLKLDRTLIAGAHAHRRRALIVESVMGLSRALGLQVTAEGVEDREDAAYLARFDPIDVQGFLFGRPRPASAFSSAAIERA